MNLQNFATFFLDKITNTCEKFTNIDPCIPDQTQVPKFTSCAPMKNNKGLEMMSTMKNESCELDTMPMALFEKILQRYINTIMWLVNISLTAGEFCLKWKTAVVKPLLKKPGLELLNKNYRPVSNLCFLPKLFQKCMLKQLMQHCKKIQSTAGFSICI